MGRKKIAIERLPTTPKRNTTYCKRRDGVLRKAHQLATLCDVQVLYLMFSPAGQLHHFCSQPGIWEILQRFIQTVQRMPENERANPPFSEDVLKIISTFAGQQDVGDHRSGSAAPDRPEIKREKEIEQEEEIKRENDPIELMLLHLEKKMMHPGREAFQSEQEFQELLQGLEYVRRMISDRGERLEPQEHSANTSYNTSCSTQNTDRQIPMQQPQTTIEGGMLGSLQGGYHMHQGDPVSGMDYPASSSSTPQQQQLQQLQEPPGYGMLDLLQGREHIEQQIVRIFGVDFPSSSSIVPLHVPMGQMQAAPGHGTGNPLQQQEDSEFGVGNLSLSLSLRPVQLFGADQQNVNIASTMPEQKSEVTEILKTRPGGNGTKRSRFF